MVAASYRGKFENHFPDDCGCLMILNFEALSAVTLICTWAALILTIISLVDYICQSAQSSYRREDVDIGRRAGIRRHRAASGKHCQYQY